jgi:hypothetical protein
MLLGVITHTWAYYGSLKDFEEAPLGVLFNNLLPVVVLGSALLRIVRRMHFLAVMPLHVKASADFLQDMRTASLSRFAYVFL